MHPAAFLPFFLRLPFALAFCAILFWQWQQITQAPTHFTPTSITIPLAPGESKILGRAELAANQADQQHLRLRRASSGHWWLSNFSPHLSVEVTRRDQEERLRTAPLTSTSQFSIAGHQFQIDAASTKLLRFTDSSGHAWQFDGVLLRAASASGASSLIPVACPSGSWLDAPKNTIKRLARSLAPAWNWLAPDALSILAPLEFGGVFSCELRIGLPTASELVSPGSVRIVRRGSGFFLSSTTASSAQVCLAAEVNGNCPAGKRLADFETSMDGISHIVVGRTAFSVAVANDAVVFSPRRRVALFTDESRALAQATPGVQFAWQKQDIWHWPFALDPWLALSGTVLVWLLLASWLRMRKHTVPLAKAVSVAGLLLGAVYLGQRIWFGFAGGLSVSLYLVIGVAVAWMIHLKKSALPGISSLVIVGAALMAAWAWLAGGQSTLLGVAWLLPLQALAMLSILCLPLPSKLAWSSFALAGVLFAVGACTQLSLGLAANDNGSLRFFQIGTARIAAGIFVWFVVTQLWRLGLLPRFTVQSMQRAIWLLALLALLALLLQMLAGNEAGVAGFQPVELAKLTLIVFAAQLLTKFMDWNHLHGLARLALAARLLVLLLTLLFAVIALLSLVHDFSPLVLLAFWSSGMLLALSLANRRWLGAVLALSLLLLMVLAVMALHQSPWREQALAFDRFAVWLEPELHPHSGAQALLAGEMLEAGGWRGTVLAQPWRLPEVQNDMTPAFFLASFGAIGGATLLLLQSLFLASLLALAWRILQQPPHGDFRALWLARLGFFSIWAYAFFLAGHFVVSWGSNLQWLPVMGQPMPFLSSAGSLALLFLLPMQLFCLPLARDK